VSRLTSGAEGVLGHTPGGAGPGREIRGWIESKEKTTEQFPTRKKVDSLRKETDQPAQCAREGPGQKGGDGISPQFAESAIEKRMRWTVNEEGRIGNEFKKNYGPDAK